MAKFLCRCGALIQTGGDVPHPTELLMIAGWEIGEDTWDGTLRIPDLYARMTHVFSCYRVREAVGLREWHG